jgi:hypothetical protein
MFRGLLTVTGLERSQTLFAAWFLASLPRDPKRRENLLTHPGRNGHRQ